MTALAFSVTVQSDEMDYRISILALISLGDLRGILLVVHSKFALLLQNVKVAFEKSFKNPVLRLFLRAIKWKKKKTFSFPNVEQIRPNRKERETHIRLKFYILNNSLDVVKTTTTFRNKKREKERNVCLFAPLRGLAEWAQKSHVTLAIAPRLSPSAFGWTVIDKTGIETPLHLAEIKARSLEWSSI